MAGATAVLTDDSRLSRLELGLYKVEEKLALTGGLAVLSLMLLAVVSVGGRNFFNRPVPGYVDWIEQIMPVIAFIGMSYCQRLGGHIRMDMVIGKFGGRPLWMAELFGTLLILILALLMIWGSWAHFERSFEWTSPYWSRDSSLDIRLPLWPAKLLVPIAFSVMAVRLVLQAWGYGKAVISGVARPVAVPLIQDMAEIAADEARAVSGLREGESGAA